MNSRSNPFFKPAKWRVAIGFLCFLCIASQPGFGQKKPVVIPKTPKAPKIPKNVPVVPIYTPSQGTTANQVPKPPTQSYSAQNQNQSQYQSMANLANQNGSQSAQNFGNLPLIITGQNFNYNPVPPSPTSDAITSIYEEPDQGSPQAGQLRISAYISDFPMGQAWSQTYNAIPGDGYGGLDDGYIQQNGWANVPSGMSSQKWAKYNPGAKFHMAFCVFDMDAYTAMVYTNSTNGECKPYVKAYVEGQSLTGYIMANNEFMQHYKKQPKLIPFLLPVK
jgi:hypothetical protein